MSETINNELQDYYHKYCELTIWFKKIVLQSSKHPALTIQDITKEFIAERNRILTFVPIEEKRKLKNELNGILKSYCSKVAHWSKTQKITIDMV